MYMRSKKKSLKENKKRSLKENKKTVDGVGDIW